ncbi:hypothetical protein M8J77_021340 [Diaphorina citri]|nr:hypothetical protein M8J77_021340 [Diaphorina citri]
MEEDWIGGRGGEEYGNVGGKGRLGRKGGGEGDNSSGRGGGGEGKRKEGGQTSYYVTRKPLGWKKSVMSETEASVIKPFEKGGKNSHGKTRGDMVGTRWSVLNIEVDRGSQEKRWNES